MTELQRAIAQQAALVQANIINGRTGDYAKEDAVALFRLAAMRLPAEAQAAAPTCPGCSGAGDATTDPQVRRCQNCGGVFTDWRNPIAWVQALAFVALEAPMKAEAGALGSFYFDLDIRSAAYADCCGGRRRLHGWADVATKRVVQWG